MCQCTIVQLKDIFSVLIFSSQLNVNAAWATVPWSQSNTPCGASNPLFHIFVGVGRYVSAWRGEGWQGSESMTSLVSAKAPCHLPPAPPVWQVLFTLLHLHRDIEQTAGSPRPAERSNQMPPCPCVRLPVPPSVCPTEPGSRFPGSTCTAFPGGRSARIVCEGQTQRVGRWRRLNWLPGYCCHGNMNTKTTWRYIVRTLGITYKFLLYIYILISNWEYHYSTLSAMI